MGPWLNPEDPQAVPNCVYLSLNGQEAPEVMNSRLHKRPDQGLRQQQRCAAELSHQRDWSQAGVEEVAACIL